MKYIILRSPEGAFAAVCSPAHFTHADLAQPYLAQGYTAQSAGFLRFLPEGRFETFGHSESLHLEPHGDDARLLSAFYTATLALNAPKS
jgi:hypothetical protein